MFRTLAAALLVAIVATAHAQTAQLPPAQQIQRQQPTLPAPQLQLGTYVYTARTAAVVRRSGAVTASGITWACQGTACTVTGPWPQPGVGACTALMREIGRIVSYGRQGAMLNAGQLAQCNGVPSNTPSSPPPPPPPPQQPPPPPPAPSSGSIAVTSPELSVVGGGAYVPPPALPPIAVTSSEISIVGGGAYAPPPAAPPIAVTSPEISVIGQ